MDRGAGMIMRARQAAGISMGMGKGMGMGKPRLTRCVQHFYTFRAPRLINPYACAVIIRLDS